MKKLIISILILLIFSSSPAFMKITPRLKFCYMTFALNSLKHFQEDLYNEIINDGIEVKKIDNFPNTISYQIQFLTEAPKCTVGLALEFASTGSRLDYRDYTGNYTIDQILNHFSLGIILEKVPFPEKNSKLIQYINLATLFDSYTIKEELKIFGEVINSNENSFSALGYGFETGFRYILLQKPLIMMLNIGYQATFHQSFRFSNDYNVELHSSRGAVKPDWNGFRLGIIIQL